MQQRWAKRFCIISSDAPLEWMQENDRAYSQVSSLLLLATEEFQVDLLHCNQFCFGFLPAGVPKIVTAHSDVLSWANYCRNGSLEDSAWLRHYRVLVQRGLSGAQAVVAPTRWMLDALSRNFELPEDRRMIANGRSIRRVSKPSRKLQAVTAGRLWDEAKNIRLLGDVSSPVPLLIVGDAASGPSSPDNATVLGPLAEKDLLALFGESDLYICPSRYEPFGLAPLEAALCGCAVLANNIPSLREVWQEGALYFHDADSLSKLLHRLNSDKKLLSRAQISSTVQARTYTREKMASAYLTLFQQVLMRDKDIADVA
jgi:glycosyltransferase involved in cell wall biosynthesis